MCYRRAVLVDGTNVLLRFLPELLFEQLYDPLSVLGEESGEVLRAGRIKAGFIPVQLRCSYGILHNAIRILGTVHDFTQVFVPLEDHVFCRARSGRDVQTFRPRGEPWNGRSAACLEL